MSRTGPILVLAITLALAVGSPALAYDTGPHSEITRDAMGAEGFRDDAIGVAQVNNWFVDLYEQRRQEPVLRARRILEAPAARGRSASEDWPDERGRGRRAQPFRRLDDDAVRHGRRDRTSGTGCAAAIWTLAARRADQKDPASC